MNNPKEYIWYTGDWKQQNNIQVPYNGLQIRAKATYSDPTSPPSSQKLVSVAIDVVDYTKSPNGVASSLVLYRTAVWYDIPIPEDNTVSPPSPNSDFTVTGIDGSSLGELQLDSTSSGIYLNIQFRYGIYGREELGFIMKINETYQEGENSIIVSG